MFKNNLDRIITCVFFAVALSSCKPESMNLNNMPGADKAKAIETLPTTPTQTAQLEFVEDILDFGFKVIHTESVKTLELVNTGTGTASFTSEIKILPPFSFVGGSFPGDGGNCSESIRPNEKCSVSIMFSPVNPGEYQNSLTLFFKRGGVTERISANIYGTGLTPAKLVLQSINRLNFGNLVVGVSKAESVVIENIGQATALNVGSLSSSISFGFDGGFYPGKNGTCGLIILSGEICTIKPKFNPLYPGIYDGEIKIAYSNGLGDDVLTLSTKGSALSEADLFFNEAPSLSFGIVPVGADLVQSLVLTNQGESTAALLGFGTSLASPFEYAGGSFPGDGGTCGDSLAGGRSCVLSIKFSPELAQVYSKTSPFSYNSGLRTKIASITLTGVGSLKSSLKILEAPTYDFGSTTLKVSSFKTLTISNTGGETANFSSISGLSNSFGFKGNTFPGTGGTCGVSIGAGESCSFVVYFKPLVSGVSSSNLKIDYTDRVSSNSTEIELKGLGVDLGNLVFEKESINFNTSLVTIEKTLTVNLTNKGETSAVVTSHSISLPFSLPGGSFPGVSGTCESKIEPNETCSVSIKYLPTVLGMSSGVLTVNYYSGEESKQTSINLSGEGVSGSELGFLDGSDYSFGQIVIGKTATKTLTLKNFELMSAINVSPQPLSAPFAIKSTTCFTVLSLGQCDIVVTYSPSLSGTQSSLLKVRYFSGISNKEALISLSGEGKTKPSLVITDGTSYDFGKLPVTTFKKHVFTLKNTGETEADNISPSVLSSGFVYTGGFFPGTNGTCGTKLSGGSSCLIDVSFYPLTSGVKTSSLKLNYGEDQSEFTSTSLSGLGETLATLTFNVGASYDFGNKPSGSLTEKTIIVSNTGESAATNISGSTLLGSFSYVGGSYPGTGGDCSSSLTYQQACSIKVKFAPSSAGSFSKSLSLQYTDGKNDTSSSLNLIGSSFDVAILTISDGPTYNFGSKTAGSTSTHSFTLTNTGGYDASSVVLGSVSSPFSLVSNSCPGVMKSGDSCSFSVDFSPVSSGTFNGSLTASYQDGNSSANKVIGLTGSAKTPANLSFTSSLYDHGTVLVDQSSNKTLTVSNSGETAATGLALMGVSSPFTYIGGVFPGAGANCSSSLNPGQSCTINIKFTPTTEGVFSANIDLQYSNGVAPGSAASVVRGTGKLSDAILTISDGPTYSFGSVFVSQSKSKTFTVSNGGQASASITGATTLSNGFKYIGGSFPGTGGTCSSTLVGGGSCTFSVEFTPTSAGAFTNTISLSYNNGSTSTSASVNVSGSAQNLAKLVFSGSPTIDLGTVYTNSTNSVTIQLENQGGVSATSFSPNSQNTSYTYSGGSYPGSGGTCSTSLSSGSTCQIKLTFAPATTGVHNTTMSIQYIDGSSSKTESVSVTANVVNRPLAILSFSQSEYDFGVLFSGSTQSKTLTVTNSGTANATTVSSSSLNSGFSFKGGTYPGTGGTCGSTINKDASCLIVVDFNASATGSYTNNLTLSYHNGFETKTSSTVVKAITHTVAQISSSPASFDFGERYVGTNSVKTFTFTNNGTTTATGLSFSSLSAPFSFSSNTCETTLAGGGSCQATVRYSPTDPGSYSGNTLISYNNGRESSSTNVSITGTSKFEPGSVDLSFGSSGFLKSSTTSYSSFGINKTFIYSDRIYGIGFNSLNARDLMATKVTANGSSLDSSFNSTGIVSVDDLGGADVGHDVVVDDSESVYAVGSADSNKFCLLAKFNSNGSLNSSFGTSGKKTLNFTNGTVKKDACTGVIVAGSNIFVSGFSGPSGDLDFVVSKINKTTGNFDTSFAGNGFVKVGFNGDDMDTKMAIQSDGKLVVVGTSHNSSSGKKEIGLARINSNGTGDSTYGSSGKTRVAIWTGNHEVKDMKLLSNNSVIVLSLIESGSSSYDVVVSKFNSNGGLDLTFGFGGYINLGNWGTSVSANLKLEIQSDGKILVGGMQRAGSLYNAAIARINSNGGVDSIFGTAGTKIITEFYGVSDSDFGLSLQSSGKIVVTSRYDEGSNYGILTLRLHP